MDAQKAAAPRMSVSAAFCVSDQKRQDTMSCPLMRMVIVKQGRYGFHSAEGRGPQAG